MRIAMLKLATAAALVLVMATPALAQQHTKRTTITSTTTTTEPAPQRAAPPQVTVAPLPPDPAAGPGGQPQSLGALTETVTHPGTVTTSGKSTTVKLPDWQIRSGAGGSYERTERRLGVP
jgi:hypothetical protein